MIKISCLECSRELEVYEEDGTYEVVLCPNCLENAEVEAKALGFMEGINHKGDDLDEY